MGNRCFSAQCSTLGAQCSVAVLSAVVLTAVVLSALVLGAQTPTEQANALSRRAAERLAALQREAEGLAKQERTLLGELRKLEIERQIRETELAQATHDADDVRQKLEATTVRAQSLQGEADRQRPDVDARMV